MPSNTDTRIVEMQFENKQFEKGISTSQKSLERFKKDLNFDEATRGVEQFSKALDDTSAFSKLSDNIERLADRFTGLGSVSELVIRKIRSAWEGAASSIERFVGSLTTEQTKVGFGKYETLNKSVQSLVSATQKDEKEIYGVLERLNDYTDQTSYDFSQGVTSISQLVSSGAATLEQAERIVEGFYNYAAKAGADTATASMALNFSMVQAMNKGYLDLQNSRELARRNVMTLEFKETLIQTGVEMGKVIEENGKYYVMSKKGTKQKKVEINATNLWDESLQQQWVTTKLLNKTLLKYADTNTDFGEAAFAAAQRCTTFTDALNAWKDMLSTGWMTTYRTVFGDLGEAMQLFSGICDKVGASLEGLSKTRNTILEGWKISGGKDSLWSLLVGEFESPDEGVKNKGAFGFLDIFKGIGDVISNSFWNTIRDSMADGEKLQVSDFSSWTEYAINEAEKAGLFEGLNAEQRAEMESMITEAMTGDMWEKEGFREIYLGVKLTELTEKIQKFIASVKDYLSVTDDKTGETRLERIQHISDAIFNTIRFIGSIIGGIFDFIGGVFDNLSPSFDAILNFLSELGLVTKDTENDLANNGGISKFFKDLAASLKPLTDIINDVVTDIFGFFTDLFRSSKDAKKSSENAEKSANGWQKFSDFIKGLADILRTVIDPIKNGIAKIFGAITSGTEKGSKASKDGEKSFSFLQLLLDILTPIGKALGFIIGLVSNLVSEFITWGKESGTFSAVWEFLKGIFVQIGDTLSKLSGPFVEFFSKLGSILNELFTNGISKESLSHAWDSLKEAFSGLTDGIGALLPGIGSGFKGIFDKLFGIFKKEKKKSESKYVKKDFALDPSMMIAMGGVSDASTLKKTEKDVENEADTIDGFGQRILGSLSQMFDGVRNIFSKFKQFMGKDSDLEAILAGVLGILGVIASYKLISKSMDAIQSFGNGLSDVSKALTGNMTPVETLGDKILKISASIGIITAAVFALGKIPIEEGIKGLVGVVLIMGALLGFIALSKKVAKDVDWKSFSSLSVCLIAIGIALGAIMKAIKPFMEMKQGEEGWEQFGRACIGMIVALLSIGAMMAIIGKTQIKFKDMTGILLIAIALKMISDVMVTLTALSMDESMVGAATRAFVGLAAIMGLMIKLAKVSSNGSGVFSVGLLFVGLAALLLSLKSFSSLANDKNWLGKSAVMFVGLTVVLGLLIGFVALLNKVKGFKAVPEMKGLMYVALSIGIIILALSPLAAFGWESLGKMGAGLTVLLGVLLGFTIGLSKLGGDLNNKGLAQILILALGISSILVVLMPLALFKWESLGKMGAAFGGIIVGLLLLVGGMRLIENKLGGGMKGSLSIATLAAFVAGIAALILILSPLALASWDSLAKMGASFGALVIGLTVAVGIIQATATKLPKAIGSMFLIVGFAFSISELISALLPIGEIDWNSLGRIGAAFAGMLIGLTVAVVILGKTAPKFKKAIGASILVLSFAFSLTEIANAFKIIGSLDVIKYNKTIGSFSIVLLGLAGSVILIQKTAPKFSKALGSIFLISAFVASLYVIIKLLEGLIKYDSMDLRKIKLFFATIAGTFASAIKSMLANDVNIQKALSLILVMGAFVKSIESLIDELMPLVNLSWAEYAKVFIGFELLVHGLSEAVADIMESAAEYGGGGFGVLAILASFIGIAGSIYLFGLALEKTKDVKLSSIIFFTLCLKTLINSTLKSIGKNVGGGKDGILKASSAIIELAGLAGAMLAFGFALEKVKDIKNSRIIAFSIGLLIMMNAMKGLYSAVGDDGKEGIKKATAAVMEMAGLAGAMLAFGFMLNLVRDIKSSKMIAFAVGIVLMMNAMKGVYSATGDGNKGIKKATASLIEMGGLVAAMVTFGLMLNMVKDMKTGAIIAFSLGLSVMMLVMSKVVTAMGKANIGTLVKGILAMVIGIAAILGVFALIGPLVLDSLAKSMQPFSESLTGLGEAIASFASNTSSASGVDLSGAFSILSEIAKLQLILTGQNISLAVFSKLTGQNIPAGDLMAFGADLGTIGKFVGEFASAVADKDFSNVDQATKALQSIAKVQSILTAENIALTVFEKLTGVTIPEGNLGEFADSVVEIAPALAKIGDALEGRSFANFDQAATALTKLSSVTQTLNGQNILMSVFSEWTGVSLGENTLTTFCNDIKTAAPLLLDVGNTFENTKFDNFSKASDALLSMSQVSLALNGQDILMSVFSKWTGEKIDETTISNFCEDIKLAAPKLVDVGNTLQDFDDSHIEDAVSALKAMSSVSSALAGQDIALSLASWITGERIDKTTFSDFCEDIAAAAPLLQKAGDDLDGFDDTNIKYAADAMAAMVTVQTALDNNTIKMGVFKALFPDSDFSPTSLEQFADQMVSAAPSLSKLSTELEGLNFDNVQLAATAMTGFAAVQTALTDDAVKSAVASFFMDPFGLKALISGKDQMVEPENLSSFGDQIVELGKAMAKFAKSVSYVELEDGTITELNVEAFNSAVGAVSALSELQTSLPNLGSIFSFITGEQQTIDKFADGLGALGTGVNALYKEAYKVIDGSDVSIEGVSALSSIFDNLAKIALHAHMYHDQMEELDFSIFVNKLKELTGLGSSGELDKVTAFLTAFDSAYNDLGRASILPSSSQKITEVLLGAGNIENYDLTSFGAIGEQISKGLAQGILDNGYLVTQAIATVTGATVVVAEDEVEVNSPSKVFMRIGQYISEGLALGILGKKNEAESAVTDLGDSIVENAGTGMAAFASLMAQDLDTNPVITPVIDLSNIRTGAEYINSALNGETAMSLGAGIASSYASKSIPDTNGSRTGDYTGPNLTAIQNSIANLGTQINNMGQKISNMQIVLDSGALVGAVAGGVSKNIGQKSTYGRRRNA